MFTRVPEPRKAKTRLIPPLTADQAAALQRAMTEDLLDRLDRTLGGASPESPPLSLEVRYGGQFSSGALVDANAILGSFPGDENTTDPEGQIKQPFHSPEASGGFLIVSVTPDGSSARAGFRFYDEMGQLLYEHEKTAEGGR